MVTPQKALPRCLYRDKEIRKYQIFACTDTTAYTLINPTVLSTKSGGPMAGAWAILTYLGEEGFMHIVKTVQEATKKLIDGINAIPELEVLGQPAMCMFSFKSDVINVYQLGDAMAKRGWYIQGQFSTPLTPRNLHISVNYGTTHQVEALLKDLGECVEEVKQDGPDRQRRHPRHGQRSASKPGPGSCVQSTGRQRRPGRHRPARGDGIHQRSAGRPARSSLQHVFGQLLQRLICITVSYQEEKLAKTPHTFERIESYR
jgi:hypothetical protein